jgi:hypothetical protein
MTERELYSFWGKDIIVTCVGEMKVRGHCSYFTQSIDNEPEEASIALDNGYGGLTEIYLHEIKSIEEIK